MNPPERFSYPPLFFMALGTFAVGTESFVIAGLLPEMARDLHASVVATGQLVTVFSLAYALSSPILTALTGHVDRRRMMIFTMLAFSAANILAWAAPGYWTLMAARVLLAGAAGLYVPGANALAGVVAGPERRGKALAIVNGGISVAIAFGVPFGALIGNHLGWRMTFACVAVLSAVATLGLIVGMPSHIGKGMTVASLRQRLRTVRQPAILLTLLVTMIWATGAYTMYTYLALFVSSVTRLDGAQIGYILFTWGASAAIGVVIGGEGTDRLGPRRVVLPSLALMVLVFATMSWRAHLPLPGARGSLLPILFCIVGWGMAHWAFYPAQQVTLIGVAGVAGTPIALSMNASFMYLGFSLGASLGSLTISLASVSDLGWSAATCEMIAFALSWFAGMRYRARKAALGPG
ncbi:MFS transporter [Burkholderia plantarii]|uniref:MFS transporter n=1 Tax=Burkholderia plantarii TaxID=41899 RepID=UPI0007058398|nr:MFS transporter [Burkholderia plantarii]ALK34044.1 arabinose efflux permease family protein [Burkholderia plantarii]GLZ21484.1 MFS transporter [Burkholderia plantarii]